MKRRRWITVCALLSALMLAACGTRSGDAASPKEREALEEKDAPGEKGEPESTDTEEEETEPELETPEEEEPSETESGESGAITAGTSMEDAAPLLLGEKAYGTVGGEESAWFSFTTDQNEDAVYNITFVNTTAGTYNLGARLCDEYGEELGSDSAGDDGTPSTIRAEELEPDTTYYIRLYPYDNEEIDYTLTVKNPDAGERDEMSGKEGGLRKTSGEEEEPEALDGDGAESARKKGGQEKNDLKGTEAENGEEELVPGSSQKDAVLLPLGTKVFGTVEEDGNAWFAFTTGDDPEAVYKITAVNASPNTEEIDVYLYDEYGTRLSDVDAQSDGVPATISAEELECDTTYYVQLSPWRSGERDYSLIIKNPDDKTTAYRTAGTFSESQGAVSEEGVITAGTNANGAVLLSLGTKVSGTVEEDGNAWFAFTTGEDPEAVYKITAVNASPNTEEIDVYLYDEYGTRLSDVDAQSDGVPATISAEELECDTTYYVQLSPWRSGEREYTLLIQSPEVKKEEPSPLVFEKPFEINETQVQFVINQAVFIDENQAKEVLRPVAEAILEHPDHSILIAGTTATDMTQEQCVDLSLRRAEAVKKLLVDTYQVPESQLQIVGLGYEKDPFERGKDRDANGNFVESEGKKNRRVVILDIDDPIAQELLQNNQ